MPIETASFVNQLNADNPVTGDDFGEGDDHLRMIKACIRATWPNMTAIACTPTTLEFNHLVGVTSPIQTQINAKANTTTGSFSSGIRLGTPSAVFGAQALHLDQGAATGEILSFQSSNASLHNIINEASASTFGAIRKHSQTTGGIAVTGFTGGAVGMSLKGAIVSENAARSIAALGAIMLTGVVQDVGTANTISMSPNRNIVVISDGSNTRFIFDSDGDSHQDVGTAWTNYDHLDDVGTLNAIAYNVARADDPIKRKFGEWMTEQKALLTEQNLVKFNDDGHHFVNMSKLTMLHTGAIRQMSEKMAEAMEKVGKLTAKLNQLELKNA